MNPTLWLTLHADSMKYSREAGDPTPWLRALRALSSNDGSQASVTPVPGIQHSLVASMGTSHTHTVHSHTCRQNAHTHKIKLILFNCILNDVRLLR